MALSLAILALASMSCSLFDRLGSGAVQQGPLPAEEVVAAVEAFDPADLDGGLERLNQAALRGEPGSVAALGPALQDPDPTRRWAAAYVAALLAETPEDSAALAASLDDPDPTVRLLAAGSLVGLGDVRAIPVLIEGLDDERQLPYGDPPEAASALAQEALQAYTGQHFADPAEWRAWWQEVEGSLHWDGERYVQE